ncbi:hypothetical protein X777_12106 [Ooceraea biroi]|uniref:Uncharacterized protein n=1 Tax=Ooceraea biroi TaxID=2015173 RepID=A0A026W1V8_OOCBI|nr:hypothetical protein X777_12106 [Ooceraea biroi]
MRRRFDINCFNHPILVKGFTLYYLACWSHRKFVLPEPSFVAEHIHTKDVFSKL